MTATENLLTIKHLAKKLARARRIKHISALELTAHQLGYPHWNALTADYKKGWRPSSTQITALLDLVDAENPLRAKEPASAGWDAFSHVPGIALRASRSQSRSAADPFSVDPILGELDGHPFRLNVILDDVVMEGRGWQIVVPEAPSASPEIRVTDRRIKLNPVADQGFQDKAVRAAQIRAQQVRARISSDWPRRSTVADADGRTQHPLFGGIADRWFCLHCDQVSSGRQMAQNLWHCPACGSAPIDIHISKWW
ncbi:hypothetical protein X727_16815 [Mesorhizobium sp. L103C119B0]|uniref:glyoxalase superfamily protein n=1 Tax=Mesorhizobium sp. L103C119B0 TaxID=1287085 RepID=UPI0003CFCF25|nr:glyoxalase superfamily protein [Mesorhizobium sp. L103C119B0]ESZ69536.1 hypothetical protein X727_16815 [Mesorhizobium sp. L103C119B0]